MSNFAAFMKSPSLCWGIGMSKWQFADYIAAQFRDDRKAQRYASELRKNAKPMPAAAVRAYAEAQARRRMELEGGSRTPAELVADDESDIEDEYIGPFEVRAKLAQARADCDEQCRAILNSEADRAMAKNPRLWRVAVHEAGHALILLGMGMRCGNTIARSDGSGVNRGYTRGRITSDDDAAWAVAGELAEDVAGFTSSGREYDKPQPGGNWNGNTDYEQLTGWSGKSLARIEDKVHACLSAQLSKLRAVALLLFRNADREVDGETVRRAWESAPKG